MKPVPVEYLRLMIFTCTVIQRQSDCNDGIAVACEKCKR